ncbi:SDR family oxidoreductase [bacterium]|nr:SDR family oxidoreductase [bacterium]
MRILLTGATGYIGKRLLPALVKEGHEVICCVRDKKRFNPPESMLGQIEVVQLDLLDRDSLSEIPNDIDVAYYLVHSMSSGDDYKELEHRSALNFKEAMEGTLVKQVIYLSGIVNEDELSEHLSSRKQVEDDLASGSYAFTCLRAGIVIGSGSASFEIMRDLVEKLPIMVTPKWLLTRCQPIAVSDVIHFLTESILREETFNKSFDIGGDEIFTYREMLLGIAKVRKLKRYIWTVPVMTPKLSSYWLYFVTSTSFSLASSLVQSMKVEVVCKDDELKQILNIKTISYSEALERAFNKLERNEIVSSWKDAYSSSGTNFNISDFISVPEHGCFKDKRLKKVECPEKSWAKVWSIGGANGWYYGNSLWKIRGYLDKLVGGVGLRRGRTNQDSISAGDALDFWRVLYADKEEKRLLLFAEMKLPGEAWLEFKMKDGQLVQTATFRPRGVAGRLYWFSVYPFHGFIFQGLISELSK